VFGSAPESKVDDLDLVNMAAERLYETARVELVGVDAHLVVRAEPLRFEVDRYQEKLS